MDMIKLLDCTLREAPVDQFFIGDSLMREFIYRCEKVGIDIIECGFLKDTDHVFGGNCFETVEQIREYIPEKKAGVTYVALMDYGRYSLEKLSDYDGTSIDGIRICFKYGQQYEAIEVGKKIKEKGYKVFIQHVDTQDYTDIEILKFIEKVNELEPAAYAIVDTFGTMYADDLDRLAMLIGHHLKQSICFGFHAHNNLMLANANAQNFILQYAGKRKIVVDASMLGCGRGAGNAHTELLAEFLNKKYNSVYKMDELLDLIDSLMPQFRKQCSWGYSVPYFLSGIHNAHVYNVNYLIRRHNIASKDLNEIIEELDEQQKKNYDYSLLERLYVEHFDHPVDDTKVRNALWKRLKGKKVLLLAPGKTLKTERNRIDNFIEKENPVTIAINSKVTGFKLDCIFFSSVNRYKQYCFSQTKPDTDLILTSNIMLDNIKGNGLIVDYRKLIKFGWNNIDSSMILFLRLALSIGCQEIYLAGFDGFSGENYENYYKEELMTDMKREDLLLLAKENKEMLADLKKDYPDADIRFITTSQYMDGMGKKHVCTI